MMTTGNPPQSENWIAKGDQAERKRPGFSGRGRGKIQVALKARGGKKIGCKPNSQKTPEEGGGLKPEKQRMEGCQNLQLQQKGRGQAKTTTTTTRDEKGEGRQGDQFGSSEKKRP